MSELISSGARRPNALETRGWRVPLRVPGNVLLAMLLWFVPVVSSFASTYGPAPYYHNLLVNPNADDGDLSGWSITEDGGDGWLAVQGPEADETHDNGFLTSFSWARREQTIDLIAEGFSASYLDEQPPIVISEIFGKVYCADMFFLAVDLLDANQNVVHTWSSGERIHSDSSCDYSGYKEQISLELTHYGAGVRFIRWRDGGKSSEFWSGHYGTKLQNAYLALAPANLLDDPDELSSWTVLQNGGNGIQVVGPPEAREFVTSHDWARRQQTIDLLAKGFTSTELDAGDLPIHVGGSYGMVGCPDRYYLKVELLDAAMNVVDSYDSGVLTHEAACDFTYAEYREVIFHSFDDYDPGVRYVRWEDGGRDGEGWAGHFGTQMGSPYLGIINHEPHHQESDRLARNLRLRDYWPTLAVGGVATLGAIVLCTGPQVVVCAAAIGGAGVVTALTANLNTGVLLEVPSHHSDKPVLACNSGCKLDQIKSNLSQEGFGSTWADPENNHSLEILAWPRESTSASNLQALGQQLLDAMETTVAASETLVDITTLSNIEGSQWRSALARALRSIEARAASQGTSPVVRIYLGLDGVFTGFPDRLVSALARRNLLRGFPAEGIPEHAWNGHFTDLMNDLTGQLVGNTGMEIYISGGRMATWINWNHSKIVAVDGEKSIVGGHNLWNVYFDSRPVFDTSVLIHGNSTRSAHDYVDELWRRHRNYFSSTSHIVRWRNGTVTENVSSVPRSTDLLGADPIISNGIKVLGVGQTGDFYPSPLQQAVLNLLDTAEHSVYLSQQSLIHPYYELLPSVLTDSQLIATLNDGIAHRLVEKAIGGLDVKVVLSNRVVPHDTGSYIANEDLLALVWKRAVAQDGNLDSRTNRNKFCQNFGLYHLRVDKTAEVYPGSNLSFANHSKSILVDKELFLIGSHNLYEQDPSELSEFSFVVADRTEARKYYDDYWQPVLDESGRTGFDPVRCYTILKNAS